MSRVPGRLATEPVASLDAARDEWSTLAAETGNVFSTWEWSSIWWRHFGRSRPLLLRACRAEDGTAVGFLPLYLWRARPFRIVRFLGHAGADQLGPICRPGDRPAVAGALERALAESEADVFLGERLAPDEGWSKLLPVTELRHESSPVLRFDVDTWDELLRARSRNFREQARRRPAKLAERHDVRYRLANDGDRLDADLDSLFALHRARWSGTRTGFVRREAFHREFAAVALERGWLRLWLLDVDGEPRAACYGFRFGDVECFYQSGRDPAWDEHSLGFVVLVNAIREALAGGMREYRLLLGHEPYKYRFANEDVGVETVSLTRSTLSRVALRTAVAARRSNTFKRLASLVRR